jgi:CubicO group peptidase (beta-lactamase class C family)
VAPILVAIWVSGINGQLSTVPADPLDAFIRARMAERPIPGVAVAVLKDGQIVRLSTFGTASLEFAIPVTPDTVFNVASVSKSVVGVAVMRLVEDRVLDLDAAVGEYLRQTPQGWRAVTIRQLLTHTSGLPSIDVDAFSTRTRAQTVPAALAILEAMPLESPAGTKWSYNTTNYMLLGMVVEAIGKMRFTEFCRSKLFAPLGLQTATFGDSRTVTKNRATVYTRFRFDTGAPQRIDQSEVLDYSMPHFAYPGAGLNISIRDFATWMLALSQGRVISRARLEEIWEPARFRDGTIYAGTPPSVTGYGMGWTLNRRAIHPWVGGTGGLRAAFAFYPNDNLAVAVLTNFQGAGPEAIVDGVASLYFDGAAKAAQPR